MFAYVAQADKPTGKEKKEGMVEFGYWVVSI